MPELAKAYVQVIPSAKGMTSNLEKEIGGESIGSSVGGKIGKFAAKAFSALGVGKLIKDSIMQGAELEQNLGGTEAVFGKYANNIQNSAKSAYKNMGLSASDYMATANKMGSLFQGSGISQTKSLDMTSSAMQRAADVASVMGVDTNMAMESIAGAAKGNFTMMDNLGVAMNATTLKAYALEKGINFDWNTASNAEKSELAMKMFMDRTSKYAGNFAKESESTISGSLGAVKASFSDFLGNLSLGKDIGPSLTSLTGALVNSAKNIIPAIINVVMQLPGALLTVLAQLAPKLGPGVVALIKNLCSQLATQIPIIINAGVQLVMGLTTGLLKAIPQLVSAIPQIINSLLDALLSSIPQIIQCGIDLLTALVEALPTIIQSIANAMPKIINGMAAALTKNTPKMMDCGFKLLVALVKSLPKIIVTVVKAVPQIISGLVRAFASYYSYLADVGVQLIKGLWKGISSVKDWLWGKIKGFFGGIVDDIKDFFGIHSPSKVFFEIGKFLDMGLADGILGYSKDVTRAMDSITEITTGNFESELSMNATKYTPSINGDPEEINEKDDKKFTQTIIINQPTKSPAETARAIREEAINLGLAGA